MHVSFVLSLIRGNKRLFLMIVEYELHIWKSWINYLLGTITEKQLMED